MINIYNQDQHHTRKTHNKHHKNYMTITMHANRMIMLASTHLFTVAA